MPHSPNRRPRFLGEKGPGSLGLKIAALVLLWVLVTFVFAAGFYLSSRGLPIGISWKIAASIAIRNWFPWILLSPLAVILAERLSITHAHWRRNVAIHVIACLVVTLAYQALWLIAPLPLPEIPLRLPPPDFHIVGEKPPLQGAPPPPFDFAPGGLPPMQALSQLLRQAVIKTQFVIPIYWCIVCVCWGLKYLRQAAEGERRNLELQSRLTQANLQALKMQLQPHFLFNALNAISSLIHDDPKRADDMVASLSCFLRITLETSSKNEIHLGEELEFVDCYLEIQRVRFGPRLRVVREVDPACMNAMVPALVLQPLVENAIRYGIESRESGGAVTIRASRCGNYLQLEVCDDGHSIDKGSISDLKPGVGLSNTQSRLREQYGDEQNFKLCANHPTGVCVQINIPWRTTDISDYRIA